MAANKTAQPVSAGLGQDAANLNNVTISGSTATSSTMHTAVGERDTGMARVLAATPAADRAVIGAALCAGWRKIASGTAEQAWAAAGVPWPSTAPPRALGPIVRHLAAAGLIVAERWELGRSPRSHRGKVTRWRWIGGAA